MAQNVRIGAKALEGFLRIPEGAFCLVIFAHGAGSSRLSPRNNFVAEQLGKRGIATLLFDLLTESEAQERANVFDIPLLSQRVLEAVNWVRAESQIAHFPLGLFGSSTGAAAALVAAASQSDVVAAVVSRGGRPDLAGGALPEVRAPTLLIVGSADHVVIELNESAAEALKCETRLVLVPDATHLFEEPGTLEQVVYHAADWFTTHLGAKAAT
ncbi:alpha/beta hydrolase [Sulfitobacter sp. JBTF-M27]|uniref:Alpha/beta hydrolase n=2 Tax=Sulfitobacter sediminilitoris TaxID=2698830 RepID=A0A6P0CKN4_9RHOB|nr:alpha/beta hydrolase [Sulfitobacter sediminilitoris]